MNFQKKLQGSDFYKYPCFFLAKLIDHTSNFNTLESLLITQTFSLKI